jgi:hypothetical protein
LLRHQRAIAIFTLTFSAAGLAFGLLSSRKYASSATFIPQGPESAVGSNAALALAASQFGVRLPSSGGSWGPSIYVEVLQARNFLEPIALDTLVVAERGGRRVALMDLLEIDEPSAAWRLESTVRVLQKHIITASEDKKLGAVRVSVTTKWPSVSLELVERLLRGLAQFNLTTRKSQAAAERQFVEIQAREAERALREAEDRLQAFLQRNRAMSGSPELGFERDRLQREVTLRQQIYTALVQNREEAKIREVRDTPVITVLEAPRLPVIGVPRGTLVKFVLGGVVGCVLGILVAFAKEWLRAAQKSPSDEAREFFRLVGQATPGFIKRRHARKVKSRSAAPFGNPE